MVHTVIFMRIIAQMKNVTFLKISLKEKAIICPVTAEQKYHPLTAMPNCTHLLQSPSIKEFIVFSGPASKPEQIEITLGAKCNQRKLTKKRKTQDTSSCVRLTTAYSHLRTRAVFCKCPKISVEWGGKGRESWQMSWHGSLKHNIFLSLVKFTVNRNCRLMEAGPTFQERRRCKMWSCSDLQTGRGTSSERSCSPTRTLSSDALERGG